MALLANTCKFDRCDTTFSTLSELIRHIEFTHLKQTNINELHLPEAVPMSLILSYFVKKIEQKQDKNLFTKEESSGNSVNYKCECGKTYKTLRGLKIHRSLRHNGFKVKIRSTSERGCVHDFVLIKKPKFNVNM